MPSAPTRAKGDAQSEPSRYHLVSADASRRRPQRAPTRPGPVTGTPGDRYLRLGMPSVSRSRLARELPRTHTPVRTSHRLSNERNRAYFPRSMPYHCDDCYLQCTRWNQGDASSHKQEDSAQQVVGAVATATAALLLDAASGSIILHLHYSRLSFVERFGSLCQPARHTFRYWGDCLASLTQTQGPSFQDW